jgi:hypothetical protein
MGFREREREENKRTKHTRRDMLLKTHLRRVQTGNSKIAGLCLGSRDITDAAHLPAEQEPTFAFRVVAQSREWDSKQQSLPGITTKKKEGEPKERKTLHSETVYLSQSCM